MSRSKTLRVDKDKLRQYLRDNNIVPAELSRQIGADGGYLSKILGASCNGISIMGYRAICNVLHVPESTFILPDEPPAAATQNAQTAEQLDRIEQKLDRILIELGVK